MIDKIKSIFTRTKIKLGIRHETAVIAGKEYRFELIEALSKGGHLYSWVASYQGEDEFVSIRFADPASADSILLNFKVYVNEQLKGHR